MTILSAETFGDLSLTSIDGASIELAWWDKRSGGRHDGAFYNPDFAKLGDAYAGYHFLGSYGVDSYTWPNGPLLLVKDIGDGSALRRAEDFRLIWKDEGSGASLDGSFWLPVCSDESYVALGAVCVRGHGKPNPAGLRVALVHRSLTIPGQIGTRQVWNDSRTGSRKDFSAWPVLAPTTPEVEGKVLLAPAGLAAVATHTRPTSSATAHVLLLPLTAADHEPTLQGTRPTAARRDLPLRTYADRRYAFTTMVCHEGVVVALAMDEDRRIVYAVHGAGAGGDPSAVADLDAWLAEPRELAFPSELVLAGSTIGEPYAVPVFRSGRRQPEPPHTTLPPPDADGAFSPDRFLSTTARLTARAPFQAVSDGPHLYLFRQSLTRSITSDSRDSGDGEGHGSLEHEVEDRLDLLYADDDGHVLTTPVRGELGSVDEDGNWVDASAMPPPAPIVDGTLLVDRFVLVDGSLRPTGEVRFQRSRSRTRPGSGSDSLGTKDLDGRAFHEPTMAITSVRNIAGGRFAAVAVPAQEIGRRRWQVFAANQATGRLDVLDLARTADGSLDPTGSPFFTCPYHRTVFSPQPGTCQVDTGHAACRTELVPRVEGGSGAALRLHPRAPGTSDPTSPGGWVQLSPRPGGATEPVEVRDEFTIEAWVRPDAAGGTGRELLAGCWLPSTGDGASPATTDGTGAGGRTSGLWLWLIDGRRLRIGFGDGQRWNQYTTGDLVARGAWNHVAVSLDASSDGPMSLRFCVNGTQREATRSTFAVEKEDQDPRPLAAGPAGDRLLTSIGGPLWPFLGTLTELRVWRCVRSERELRAAMHQRSSGLEPDLEGYWPLDEADGDRVVDRTDRAVDGTIHDGRWVASDAPVGAHPGISRVCVRMLGANDGADQRIVSPPSATLYFQQSPAAAGYGGADKPLKRAGRVMVAMATVGNDTDPERRVAVVDVGLSATGRLAHLPADLHLWRVDRGKELALRPIAIDGEGLTTLGALLGFTLGADAPFLTDGSDGNLGLYLRARDGTLGVASFATLTDPVAVDLTDERGAEVVRVIARPSTDPADLTIEVVGDASATCELHVTAGGLRERWSGLPRDPEAFARAIDGEPDPAGSAPAEVTLEPDPKAPLPRPAVLVPPGRRTGSQLVSALPVHASGAPVHPGVGNQVQQAAPPHCRCGWTATAARRALRVRAGASATPSPRLRPDTFDAADDLTIETWLKVEPGTSPNGSIVRHRSPKGYYDLSVDTAGERLAVAREQTVFGFAGGSIAIHPTERLDITGRLTLEAWVEVDPSCVVAPVAFPRSIRNIVAHGWQPDPWWVLNRLPAKRAEGTGEDFLRICNGRYQVGSCDREGRERTVGRPIPAADLGQWVHLAGVYDGASWRLYRNGVEIGSSPDPDGALARSSTPWRIGGSTNRQDPRTFVGRIDDVRIWDRARTTEEIRQSLGEHLAAPKSWPGLAANVCADGGPVQDRSATAARCTIEGNVAREPASFPERFLASDGVWAVAEVNGLRARAPRALDGWTHVAATYRQSFAAQLADGRYLDAGDDVAADLTDDLTVEVFGRIDELGPGNGLLARGMPSPGADGGMPYALAVDDNGCLIFAFVDDEGASHRYLTPAWLLAGRPFRVAAARRRRTRSVDNRPVVWHEIVLTVDDTSEGRRTATHRWVPRGVDFDAAGEPTKLDPPPDPLLPTVFSTPAIARGAGPLVIGRSYLTSPSVRSCAMRGCVSEVRIWKEARQGITHRLRGDEAGLVSWWRFDERSGAKVADSKGTSHARFVGPARWRRDPDPRGSTLHLSIDGDVPTSGTVVDDTGSEQPAQPLTLFGATDDRAGFAGYVDELRLWRMARTRRQIQDEMFRRVAGDASEQLMAAYDADRSADAAERGDAPELLLDRSAAANHLRLSGCRFVTSDAPVGDDAPQVADLLRELPHASPTAIVQRPAVAVYGELHDEGDGRLVGTLRRTYALIRPNGNWDLLTGFKVGDLTTEWVSQIQFDPQLKGYIEGAPPVPRENLGRQEPDGTLALDDYNRASSVRLLQADSSRFTYSVNEDRGFDQQWDIAVGAVFRTDASAGFGYVQKVFEADSFIGVHSRFENSYSWLQESVRDAGQTTRRATSLELRGRSTRAGFLPDNVGLALVESETADLYALRLRRNDALVGYHLRPNPDIPPDWNIIHFPIDPAYTKQGTLDGMVGREPDDHYPNAKGQRAAWSYHKPTEAYELKDRIKREEAARVQRFADTKLPPGPGASRLPDLKRRNLVNTYVWTADGGLFIESQETMDSRRDVSGGSYRFLGLAGVKAEVMFAATMGTKFTLDALFGGHLNRVETKAEDASSSFAVDVSVDGVERDLYERDAAGQATSHRTPGKVDAYRFMTFYLEPDTEHVEDFFGRVIDPLWLEESSEPAAAALRQISREPKRGACWRVLHRVTFVSRVFALPTVTSGRSQPSSTAEGPRVASTAASPLDRPVVDSTYELIQRLEPLLDATDPQLPNALPAAIGPALVAADLDELLDDPSELLDLLREYRGTPTTEPDPPGSS